MLSFQDPEESEDDTDNEEEEEEEEETEKVNIECVENYVRNKNSMCAF